MKTITIQKKIKTQPHNQTKAFAYRLITLFALILSAAILIIASGCGHTPDKPATPTASKPATPKSPAPDALIVITPQGEGFEEYNRPPSRYGEDPRLKKAKRKYIPRHVWDVKGAPDQAKERFYLKKAVKREPRNPEPLFFLGYNYFENRMHGKARDVFLKVLKIDPKHRLALENLAAIYMMEDKYSAARSTARKGLRRHPNNPRLIAILAESFVESEQGDRVENITKGLKIYMNAFKKNVESPELLTGYGDAIMERGRLENKTALTGKSAKIILQKCIKKYPKYAKAYVSLARLYTEKREFEKAEAALLQGRVNAPWHNEIHSQLGRIYLFMGRFENAQKSLEKSLNMPYKPDDEIEVRYLLMETKIHRGQTKDVLRTLLEIRREIKRDENEEMETRLYFWHFILVKVQGLKPPENVPTPGQWAYVLSPEFRYLQKMMQGRMQAETSGAAMAQMSFIKALELYKGTGYMPYSQLCNAYRPYLETARAWKMAGKPKKAEEYIRKARSTAVKSEKKAVDRFMKNDYLLKELR